jgi:hypothetical protein
MSAVLLVIVVVATIAIVCSTFFTLRWFTAASRPQADVKPRPAKSNPHDAATTAQLKHFFEGKLCAACSRPVQPVHLGDRRPGLLNTTTNEEIAWDDIPPAHLSTMLESHAPICSHCLIVETFRRQHPELVVDRHRIMES